MKFIVMFGLALAVFAYARPVRADVFISSPNSLEIGTVCPMPQFGTVYKVGGGNADFPTYNREWTNRASPRTTPERMVLVHWNCPLGSDDIVQLLALRHLRPATTSELIRFADIDAERKYGEPIIALGSTTPDAQIGAAAGDSRAVLALVYNGSVDKYDPALDAYAMYWQRGIRFLAVVVDDEETASVP